MLLLGVPPPLPPGQRAPPLPGRGRRVLECQIHLLLNRYPHFQFLDPHEPAGVSDFRIILSPESFLTLQSSSGSSSSTDSDAFLLPSLESGSGGDRQ